MTQKQAVRFMNVFALLLQYISKFTEPAQKIHALSGFEEIGKYIQEELNTFFIQNEDVDDLLDNLWQRCQHAVKKVSQESLLKAYHMCRWMDQMLTYEDISDGKLSIYSLVPLRDYDYVKIDALNDNYRDAGIWINPKLSIFKSVMPLDSGVEIEKSIASRDAFSGINGELRNISYYPWNEEYVVHNIIVPYEYEEKGAKSNADGNLRIGFIPVSDKADLVKPQYLNAKEGRFEYRKMYIEGLTDEEIINVRLGRGLELACANNVDIVFAPEMLGTKQTEQYSGNYNMFVRRIYSKAIMQNQKPPLITIMPSLWSSRRNSAAIVYRDGGVLGRQEKYMPYIDFNSCAIEGIRQKRQKEFYLIHINGVHRIAVSICAEFIDCFASDFICGQLGATLVIVPSFSHGEKDFINKLGSLFPYGTSVVWGDCCGAVAHSPKVIGGCGLVGSNGIYKMGNNCKCDFSCSSSKGCLFIMELPLKVKYTKETQPLREPIQHLI